MTDAGAPKPATGLVLEVLPGRYAFARLEGSDSIPSWAHSGATLWSITRNGDELSLLVDEAVVPAETTRVEPGWRALRLRGPIPFETTGVIAGLTAPLAAAGIPVTPIGTFDTDVLLIFERHFAHAIDALRTAGYEVRVE